MQPNGSGLCLAGCPSGYAIVIDRCKGNGSLKLWLTFQTILPWFQDETGNFQVLNGLTETYYPPIFEPSDPLPYKNRGYLFGAPGKMVQLPPHIRSLESPPLTFNVETTIEIWVKKTATGVIQPLYWKANILPIVTLYIDSTENLVFEGGWPPVRLASTNPIPPNQWTRVILISKFNSITTVTTLTFFIDAVSSTISEEFFIRDLDKSSPQTIGATFDQTKFFTGFIWSLKVWNYALDPASIATSYSANTPTTGVLLSNCGATAEPDACAPCLATCTLGCVRTQDCNYCANRRCSLCVNFSTTECTSCIQHANMGSYHICDCNPGRYYNELTFTCDLCDPQCMRCVNPQPAKCIECYPGAELMAGPGSGCICSKGYFLSPNSVFCSSCLSSCLSCTSFGVCTACWPSASLRESSCVCNSAYYPAPDASYCLKCGQNCLLCDATGCIQCETSLYIESGACVQFCDIQYTVNSASMVCVLDQDSQTPPYAYMNISSNTQLFISFTKELEVKLANLDLGMILTDVEGFEYEISWNVNTRINAIKYPVSIQVNTTYLPSENSFTVYFPNQAKMVDFFGNMLATTELSGQLPGFGSLPGAAESSSSAYSTTQAVAGGSLASGMVLSLISGNPGTMWSLMNGMALLSYSTCLNIRTSQSLTDFFGSLNVQSFVPNPFKYILPKSDKEEAPDYGGFDTFLFLHNAGVMFTVGVSLLIYWPFTIAMSHFPIRIVAKYYTELRESFRWNVFLRYWTQIYLDVAMASFLQLSHIAASTPVQILNSLIAIFFAVAFLLTPATIMWFVRSQTQQMQGTMNFSKRYQTLFQGFLLDKGRSSLLYYPIFFSERLAISLSLIFLRSTPILQLLLCLFSTASVLSTQIVAYQVLFRPYSDLITSLTSLLSDGSSMLVFLVLGLFLWPLESESKDLYAVVLMVIVLATVVGMTLLSGVKMVITLRKLLKEYTSELKRSAKPIIRFIPTFGPNQPALVKVHPLPAALLLDCEEQGPDLHAPTNTPLSHPNKLSKWY